MTFFNLLSTECPSCPMTVDSTFIQRKEGAAVFTQEHSQAGSCRALLKAINQIQVALFHLPVQHWLSPSSLNLKGREHRQSVSCVYSFLSKTKFPTPRELSIQVTAQNKSGWIAVCRVCGLSREGYQNDHTRWQVLN